MSHHDYARPDGVWLSAHVPCAADFRSIDLRIANGIDVVHGDDVEPTTPIVIGNAGLVLSGDGALIQGGTYTRRGGRLGLGDNDWPLGCPSTKRRILSIAGRCVASTVYDVMSPSGVSLKALGVGSGFPIPTLALHQGARLATAVLRFRVGQQHAAIPATLPAFGIYRRTVNAPALSTVVGNGVLATPATASAYYADGVVQSITATMSGTYNLIDSSSYAYVLSFTDEDGAGALLGNIFHSLELNFSSIADARFE